MEPSRNLSNFEIFRAKAALFPMKIRSLDGEQSHGYVPSANLMCGRKSASDQTGIPSVTKYNRSLSYHSNGQDKLLKFPNFTFLPRQGTERSESGNCDLGTRKICSTKVDSLGEVPGRCHKLSHAMKRVNTSSSKDESIFRMRSQMKVSGNKHSHTKFSSPFFARGNRGLELKELSSSSTEGSRNFPHIGTSWFAIHNKLSADRNMVKEKSISGANHAALAKAHNNPTGSAAGNDMKSYKEIGMPWKCTTSSRSRKVPPSIRFFGVEPHFRKPRLLEDDFNYCEHRWIKRLKLSSTSPVLKKPKLAEDCSHDATRKIFISIHHNTEEPSVSRHHGKEPILNDQILESPKRGIVCNNKIEPDVVLSNIWIKRFLRRELGTKQFSSIAAMAVVGRTMDGSFQLRKKGSITTW